MLKMLIEYIQTALEKARYEIIEDEETTYGEVLELEGVWATGNTLEECRRNLEEVIDEWIVFRWINLDKTYIWKITYKSKENAT